MGNVEMKKNPAKQLRLLRTAGILSIIGVVTGIAAGIAVMFGIAVGGGSVADGAAPTALTVGAVGTAGVGLFVLIAAGIIALIAGIMQIVALIKISGAHSAYKNALITVVVGIVIQCVTFIPMNAILTKVVGVLTIAVAFLTVYFVITATIDFLKNKNNQAVAETGIKVRKLYMVCTAVIIVAELLSLIPVMAKIVSLFSLVASIVQIVALFKYISFLGKSAKALDE